MQLPTACRSVFLSCITSKCHGAMVVARRSVIPAARRSSSLQEGPAVTGAPVYAETGRVAERPPVPAAAARHAHTSSPASPPGFRVVTYNILADQYATSEHALTHLFAYCPPQCALLPRLLSSLGAPLGAVHRALCLLQCSRLP